MRAPKMRNTYWNVRFPGQAHEIPRKVMNVSMHSDGALLVHDLFEPTAQENRRLDGVDYAASILHLGRQFSWGLAQAEKDKAVFPAIQLTHYLYRAEFSSTTIQLAKDVQDIHGSTRCDSLMTWISFPALVRGISFTHFSAS